MLFGELVFIDSCTLSHRHKRKSALRLGSGNSAVFSLVFPLLPFPGPRWDGFMLLQTSHLVWPCDLFCSRIMGRNRPEPIILLSYVLMVTSLSCGLLESATRAQPSCSCWVCGMCCSLVILEGCYGWGWK